jgi:GNAT superfamily N-acetyltransferase
MYTDPRHRGKALIIIEALKEWCRSQNITELRLDVYHDNPSAIRAYESRL